MLVAYGFVRTFGVVRLEIGRQNGSVSSLPSSNSNGLGR